MRPLAQNNYEIVYNYFYCSEYIEDIQYTRTQ